MGGGSKRQMNESQSWSAHGKPVVEKSLAEWAADACGDGQGIKCPDCGCPHWYTRRTIKVAGMVKRERRCRHCGYPMTTFERPEPAISIKSNMEEAETT